MSRGAIRADRHGRRRQRPLAEHRRRRPQLQERPRLERVQGGDGTLARPSTTSALFVRGSLLYDDLVEDSKTARTPLSEAGKDLAGSYIAPARRLRVRALRPRRARARHPRGQPGGELGREHVHPGRHQRPINHFDVSALRVPGSELQGRLPAAGDGQLSVCIHRQPDGAGYRTLRLERDAAGAGRLVLQQQRLRAARAAARWSSASAPSPTRAWTSRPLGGPFIDELPGRDRAAPRPSAVGLRAVRLSTSSSSCPTSTRHRVRPLLPELPQPSAADLAAAPARRPASATAFGALNAVGRDGAGAGGRACRFDAAVATAANAGVACSGRSRRQSLAGDGRAVRDHRRATRMLAGGDVAAQASNTRHARVRADGRLLHRVSGRHPALRPVVQHAAQWTTGVALQGEVAYRQDVPLQFDDVELLFAALTPFEQRSGALRSTPLPTTCPESCAPALPTLTRCGQLGSFGLNQEVQGWGEFDVWQGQFTATKTFPPMLGASQLVLVIEAGMTHVDSMPRQDSTGGPNGRACASTARAPRSAATRAARPHCPTSAHSSAELVEPQNRFADADSWGYRVARSARIPRPHRRRGTSAALHLAAGRRRHDARSGRQFRRGPLRR